MKGLSSPTWKDVMEMGALWQMKAISHRANALQHLEGANIAWTELVGGAGLQGARRPVKKIEPHPVAHREL